MPNDVHNRLPTEGCLSNIGDSVLNYTDASHVLHPCPICYVSGPDLVLVFIV